MDNASFFLRELERVGYLPLVSVVVPLRNSGQYVNTLLASLLGQDYPNYEVVLVGSPQDSTWDAIRQEYGSDPRLHIVEATIPATHVGRDSNIKRNWGAQSSGGEVLAFTDAKIRHQKNWISQGVYFLGREDVGAVAGIMLSTEEDMDSFMAMFADSALIKRNPDFGNGHVLTADNFASRESLPITACWMMTREAFELMDGFDETFTISYEDYSAAWRYCGNGGTFYCSNEWRVYHKHRTQFKQMMLEFQRSARGAAQLLYSYPDCPFGVKRLRQSVAVLGAALVGASVLAFLVLSQEWLTIALLMILGLSGMSGIGLVNYRKAKHWYGFFFPPLTAWFIFVFSLNFIQQYIWRNGAGKFLQTAWSLVLRSLQ